MNCWLAAAGEVPRMVSAVRWRDMRAQRPFRVQALDVLPFAVKHGEDMERCVGACDVLCCAVLWWAVLWYDVLRCVVLCCTVISGSSV
jgi:hypothetical protein